MQVVDFIQDHRQPWRLNDLDRFREQTGDGNAESARANAGARGAVCQLPAESFRSFGPQRHFFGLGVRENIKRILMLRSNLHSRRGQLNLRIEGIAEDALHFRDRRWFRASRPRKDPACRQRCAALGRRGRACRRACGAFLEWESSTIALARQSQATRTTTNRSLILHPQTSRA